jgi:two-component system cell cycle response regulator CtrA
VVTELHLRDGSGFDLLEEIAARPVVIVTNANSSDARLRAFGLGVDDYITKPFDAAELVARIAAVFRRSARGGGPGWNRSSLIDCRSTSSDAW